jgi:hypothetical protein
MHQAVDNLAEALHAFVTTACGVRKEFGAHDADEDPRILSLENRVGQLNAALFDSLHETLGMHPDLTTSVWDPGSDSSDRSHGLAGGAFPVETFFVGLMLATPHTSASVTLDGVMNMLDHAGDGLVARLSEAGYDVVEWATSRGAAPTFHPDDE